MDSHRTAKSHVTAWVLAVVAVPVLYVLSVPFVVWICFGGHSVAHAPAWLVIYVSPCQCLENTPLKEPVVAYTEWVYALLAKL